MVCSFAWFAALLRADVACAYHDVRRVMMHNDVDSICKTHPVYKAIGAYSELY